MLKEVNSVFNLQDYAIKEALNCLTIYNTFENSEKAAVKPNLRAQIKEGLKECPSELTGDQMNNIAEQIIMQVIELPFHKKTIGIFCAFDVRDPSRINIRLNKNLFVLFSDVEVTEKTNCGKIFCLMDLLKMTQIYFDTLCIYVSRNETKFYILNQDFMLLEKLENEILERYEDRFTHQSPANGYKNSGSSADEKEMKFAKKILNDAMSKVKEICTEQNKYKLIIVHYTDDFANFTDFIEKETSYYSEMKPLIERRIIDTETHFEKEFKNDLESYFLQFTADKLNKYRNTNIDKTFKTDLDEIVEAARDSRIHKLYLKDDFYLSGFILNNEFPYLEKVDGSIVTNQLDDWIIKKVIQNGGEVFILGKHSDLMSDTIVAKLRY